MRSNVEQLISIHLFTQDYQHYVDGQIATASVYLTIDHERKMYSIHPLMPCIGNADYFAKSASTYRGISDIGFLYENIGQDANRHFAILACTYRAMIYACEQLLLAKPTEIHAAKKLFADDYLDSMICTNHAAS